MTPSDFQTATRHLVIVGIAAVLAQFAIQPASALGSSVAYDVPYPPPVPALGLELTPPAPQTGPADGTTVVSTVTFTIPLATLGDVRRLDQRPEITDILDTAHRYAHSPIYLAAYVTADDVPAPHVEASGVAEGLVIEVGIYLAHRGVEADRISGKGVGIDSTIGRAVVVSFDITPLRLDPPAPPRDPWWPAPTNTAAVVTRLCSAVPFDVEFRDQSDVSLVRLLARGEARHDAVSATV